MCTLGCSALCALVLFGFFLQPQGLDLVLVVWEGTWLAFLTRSWRVGITVHPDHIVKHGWFRNRKIDRAKIRAVHVIPYTGALSGAGSEHRLRMIAITLDDNRLEVPELPAYAAKSQEIYRELCTMLQLPFTDPSVPRHAAAKRG